MEKFVFTYAIGLGSALVCMLVTLWSAVELKRLAKHSALTKKVVLHLLQGAALIGLMLLLDQYARLAVSEHRFKSPIQGAMSVITLIVISTIVLRKLFLMINLLEKLQIAKGSNPTSTRIMGRVIKISITVVLLLLFGSHYGLSLSGLLAFGGIGGIAIGLAAKDILSNFFSGVLLFYDRQFNIGDWISSPDREIEGTVAEIGWRMTKIITFDNRPLYVPNSLFSSISVENPGRMTNRRINTTLALRYEDADKIAAIITDIRAMLKANQDIDQAQTTLVYFNEFGSSSLNIMVYCFTKTTVWADWLAVQQNVFLQLIEIVHKHDADFAFDTQTIYLENDALSRQGKIT